MAPLKKKLIKHENLLFSQSSVTLILEKKYNLEAALYNQLSKLIWESGISFSAWAYEDRQKCARFWTQCFVVETNEFRKICNFFIDKKFSQKVKTGKLHNKSPNVNSWIIFLLVSFSRFQYVRDILQVTVYIDHPVFASSCWRDSGECLLDYGPSCIFIVNLQITGYHMDHQTPKI